MIQLSATRCNCIATLWVSLVSFGAITACVASQRVFIAVISLSTQSGNFWIHPPTFSCYLRLYLRSSLLALIFSKQNVRISHLAFYMAHPSYPPWCNRHNDIRRRVGTTWLFHVHFSVSSSYFIFYWFKYSHKHFLLSLCLYLNYLF
jgi:hypothetical protein